METKQVYSFINDVQAEALGERAITVKDTSSLVSLGETILSSDKKTEQFYQKLVDRIGRTYIKFRRYYKDNTNLMRTPLDFGIIVQKIQTYKIATAKSNGSWGEQINPFFQKKDETDIMQSFYVSRGTWEIDKLIYDYQLSDSFKDAASMGAFIDLIFNDMYNGLEYEIEQCEKLTRATCIAQSFKSPNENITRNLLAEYNDKFNEVLTVTDCLNDASFLKYASMEINKVVKRFPRMTTVFNGIGADRFTDAADIVVECLADYVSATSSYLESGVYHKDLVSLPRYEEVDCFQASGTSYEFMDTSKINITDKDDITVEQTGIICVVRDVDSCAVSIDRIRTKSLYNPGSEMNNYYHKADWASFVDNSQNCVVFYVADADTVNPSLTVGVPTGATQLGSKTANDLQDNIVVNGIQLSGVLNYVTEYTDKFPTTPNGNFLALKFTSDANATISVKVISAKTTTDWQTLDSDGLFILRVTDKNTQSLVVKSTLSGKTTEKVIKLDRLVCDPE